VNNREFRFTPQTLRRIRSLVADGKGARSIASALGCKASSLENICRIHGIELRADDAVVARVGADRPAPCLDYRLDPARRRERPGLRPIIIEIAGGADNALAREAARRGTTATVLAARLIEIVAADDLFVALLEQ